MKVVLLAAEIVGTVALVLGLVVPPACGTSLTELNAAQGVHKSLAGKSGPSVAKSVKGTRERLDKATRPKREAYASIDGGGKSGTPKRPSKSSVRRGGSSGGGGGGRGSWATASSGRSSGGGGSGWARGSEGGSQPQRRVKR